MAAVALDLTPIVDVLLDRPFDRGALDHARGAVGGHPHAYATALRCAAKRTSDSLAAAYWLTEAARVHESVDDLGGAIALLSRVWACDPGNPRTRELMAGCMARLAVRVGLGFGAFAGREAPAPEGASGAARIDPESASRVVSDSDLRPPPRESGLRPPPPEPGTDSPRDTLPGPLGIDAFDVDAGLSGSAAESWAPLRRSSEAPPDTLGQLAQRVQARAPLVIPRDTSNPEAASNPVPLVRPSERRMALVPPPRGPELGEELEEIEELVDDAAPDTEVCAPSRPGGDRGGPVTERPAGDHLVGALFEALHAIHFLDDAREAAHFVREVVAAEMRPSSMLVHLYDINSREFVVASAAGDRAKALLDCGTPEDDPLVSEIMREDEATLILHPSDDPRLSKGRWLLVEPRRSVLCAPVVVERRFLGLIEIADPEGGGEFNEDDRNALTYVASAFGRFLARRGVVLSEEPPADALELTGDAPRA